MLEPGTLIHARYRIVGLVGQGAMGAVYEALDQRIGQPVALKQTLTADPVAMGALEREALILAGLRHPALPTVSDTFAEQDGQFLAMSFVPGPNLAEMLEQRGRAFAPGEVLAWADQILDALAYLHGQSPPVLHRDIKPQNLKLTAEGNVVLLDFGLARGAIFQTRQAGQRSVVGYTLPYAPIEQVRGQDTDPRSDLFALAGTLYHLLGGAPPPDALERAAARIAGHPDPLPPLRQRCPELPAPVAAAIRRCLSLDPSERITDAAELRQELRQTVLQPMPAVLAARPAPKSAGQANNGIFLILISLLVLFCVGRIIVIPIIAGVMRVPSQAIALPTNTPSLPPTASPLPSPTPDSLIPGEAMTATALESGLLLNVRCSHGGQQSSIAFTPDGQSLVMGCTEGLEIIRTADGSIKQFSAYDIGDLVMSADGQTLAATVAQEKILLWRLSDGKLLRSISVDLHNNYGAIALSPDGQNLAVNTYGGMRRYRVADGSLIDTIDNPDPGSDQIMQVAYSPSGKYLAGSYETGIIRIWALEGEQTSLILEHAGPGYALHMMRSAFSPDETYVIVSVGSGPLTQLRISDGALLTSYGGDARYTYTQAAISPDGALLAVGDSFGRVEIYAFQDGVFLREVRPSGSSSQAIRGMAFAPDRRSLAVVNSEGLQIWAIGPQALLRHAPERQPQE
ncbi:protein kinase [Chloroflexales bacterium ZM16-3]|nr:protein kinase [Chloroflexales bacterium ZM16-3]